MGMVLGMVSSEGIDKKSRHAAEKSGDKGNQDRERVRRVSLTNSRQKN